jgi:BirA family transcriptional regulator, biotin operon repressor / biotin---[acetyl-CoA-carboxylase] ligase
MPFRRGTTHTGTGRRVGAMCAPGPLPGDPAPFITETGPAGSRFAEVRHFVEIDSTNRYLLDEARSGTPEGVVAVADHQSAGRGRLGRRWEAPPGSNLLVSVLLRPTVAVGELHLCTVAVALAAADACDTAAGIHPDVKWPNDLLVGGRKLAGILAEALPADAGGGASAVVVGLGLNVRWPGGDGGGPDGGTDGGTDDLMPTATSIWRETGVQLEPMALLQVVLAGLEPRLADLASGSGRRRLAGEYRRRCCTVGRAVRVELAGEVLAGTAVALTGEGHLVVDTGSGRKTVAAGDVVHLRDPS